MPKLPAISGGEMVRIASELGFKVVRQRGSHVIMERSDCLVTIPLHRELKKGTLLHIIRSAGISREELEKRA
jgi:predicted RNA binding protein YcfA (HicA-like mRNA interferase family)